MNLITTLLLAFSIQGFSKNLALKNFTEVFYSLSVSTNEKPDAGLFQQFQDVKEFLPKQGVVEEYGSPMQMGLLRLAGDFCSMRVIEDSLLSNDKRFLHAGVDFSKSPDALPESERQKVLGRYAEAFWQRLPTKEEEAILLNGYSEMAKSVTDTKKFFTFLCVAFGTSVDFLTI